MTPILLLIGSLFSKLNRRLDRKAISLLRQQQTLKHNGDIDSSLVEQMRPLSETIQYVSNTRSTTESSDIHNGTRK